ncbi:MAG: glutamate-ammonia-ligase adenylyltransferase, partial [Spirochaetales bacterium]
MDDIPEVPEDDFFLSHLAALPDNYFDNFTPLEIAEHARILKSLGASVPCDTLVSEKPDGFIECTVFAFDKPGVFSLIVGLLSAAGFTIHSGLSFTYAKQARELKEKRRIIDRFTGSLKSGTAVPAWQDTFTEKLKSILSLSQVPGPEGLEKAKQRINEEVVAGLPENAAAENILYPIQISIEQTPDNKTRLFITSEDTPFFLYSLSSALALHNISIETVRITTNGSRVEDEFEITDLTGEAVTDPVTLNQLRVSVIFTKQFTYFLSKAPDPYSALVRFESIIQNVLSVAAYSFWEKLLSDPGILKDLARLLGASDFIWEDFIRLQYENIFPMLTAETRGKSFSHLREEISLELSALLDKGLPLPETKKELNEIKDREIYLIDLDHILDPDKDFLFLSRKLTDLAELVVETAVSAVMEHYAKDYGTPLSFAGMEAGWTVMGLGKLGGAALGYASDIELLFIYSDNGETTGPEKISNSEFFNRLWTEAISLIEAKRQGIFRVDTRLRPFGSAGPMACSLENFCRYYGREGSAHSYELLALIRMRALAGSRELGKQVERLRDEMVYSGGSLNLEELRALREKQLKEKTVPGRWNAKFSPGALVDLEYTVQILQSLHGADNHLLRTPRIHIALKELMTAGILSGEEEVRLVHSYHFFRRLINGLRMLRGSAEDLFLPEVDSDEYVHLARRMGYQQEKGLSPSRNMHLEFETRTAQVRRFVETYLGRPAVPGAYTGNAADLVLSETLTPEAAEAICRAGGFSDAERARENLKTLAGRGERRQLFAWLAVLAWDVLITTPDPDMALNNWERFVSSPPSEGMPSPEDHFNELFSQPRRLEILLKIFAGSQYFADTLIRNPVFFEWVSSAERLYTLGTKERMMEELAAAAGSADSVRDLANALRLFKKREVLRIGTRDICFGVPIQEIILELSNLAEACIQTGLDWLRKKAGLPEQGFCILAFGKLGGSELNYSSDIDLLGLSA